MTYINYNVDDNHERKDRMMDYCVELTDKGLVKPGEHWCPDMTLDEAIRHTKDYINSTGWSGRTGFIYLKDGTWKIQHIGDVSEKVVQPSSPPSNWTTHSPGSISITLVATLLILSPFCVCIMYIIASFDKNVKWI